MVPTDPDYIALALDLMERIEEGVEDRWENRWKGKWVVDYRDGGVPIRPDGTPFRGVDGDRLWEAAKRARFRSPYWFTLEEARARGARVTKRDRAVVVRRGAGEDVVVNVQDISGLPAAFYRRSWEVSPLNSDEPLAHVEAFIRDLPLTVEHRIDVDNPTPGLDEKTGVIGSPPWELFADGASYCRAIAHEVVHWARRERHNVFEGWGWQLRRPWEEMVADIGAAFLVSDLTGSRAAFDD